MMVIEMNLKLIIKTNKHHRWWKVKPTNMALFRAAANNVCHLDDPSVPWGTSF